jgi:hypothetical protein
MHFRLDLRNCKSKDGIGTLSALEPVSAVAFGSATTLSTEGDEASATTSFFSWKIEK